MTPDFNNEVQVEDGENFISGQSYGIKEIALEQYRRCLIEGSKEMHIAHTKTAIVKGVPLEVDVPNQREIFINCVISMETLLVPFFVDNEKIKDMIKPIDEEITELTKIGKEKKFKFFKDYNDKQKAGEPIEWSSNLINIVMPYELQLVELYRKKFVVLSLLINELNYFGEASAIG